MQPIDCTAERCQIRAAEVRCQADRLTLPVTRQMLFEVAANYEKLANMLDARAHRPMGPS